MSETLTKLIVDCSTGEESIVPLTEEEIAQLEIERANAETRRLAEEAEIQAKAEARANGIAKLVALGLTEEEAEALVK